MIWDIILSNLIEASTELEELRDRILACLKPDAEEERRGFIEFSFLCRWNMHITMSTLPGTAAIKIRHESFGAR